MNPIVGWALAALAVAIAWQKYGWQGAAFAVTLVVFWLLLQFNRAIKVMKNAASAPVGHLNSGVMFNSQLKRGMTMIQVVGLSRSLGRKVSDKPETWSWSDASDAAVTLVFRDGKLDTWTLVRGELPAAAVPPPE